MSLGMLIFAVAVGFLLKEFQLAVSGKIVHQPSKQTVRAIVSEYRDNESKPFDQTEYSRENTVRFKRTKYGYTNMDYSGS